MANPHTELLEIILRECAAAQPHPWYPSEYARSTGLAREPLDASLDQLRLARLVQLTPWVQGHGQGYQLTPAGAEVLGQPRLLGRLRQGQVPEPRQEQAAPALYRHALAGLRGDKVRDALLDDSRPMVTQVLLALNILWFFVGFLVYSLRYGGSAGEYFSLGMSAQRPGGLKLALSDIDTGSLFIVDVLDRQQWWRLLTYGFVHGGVLHVGMNMYALYVLGPLLERMWGRAAFLAIYLASCVGGGAAALVFSPTANLVGASGALCGLLGSMATWVYLNRHYLPPHIVSAWRGNIMQNVVLIAIISFLPGISMAAHAGGGLTGAVVAVPLCVARFGNGSRRLLGWLGMAAVSIVGLALMIPPVQKFGGSELMDALRAEDMRLRQIGQVNGEAGDAADRKRKNRADEGQLAPAHRLLLKADEAAVGISNDALVFFKQPVPDALDVASSDRLHKSFQQQQAKLQEYIAALEKTAPSAPADLREVIQTGLAWFGPTAEFSGRIAKVCEAGRRITVQDRQLLWTDYQKLSKLHDEFHAAWVNYGQ